MIKRTPPLDAQQKYNSVARRRLYEIIAERGINQAEVGRRCNVSQSKINRICNGDILPTLHTAVVLEDFTNGAIKPRDWLE